MKETLNTDDFDPQMVREMETMNLIERYDYCLRFVEEACHELLFRADNPQEPVLLNLPEETQENMKRTIELLEEIDDE